MGGRWGRGQQVSRHPPASAPHPPPSCPPTPQHTPSHARPSLLTHAGGALGPCGAAVIAAAALRRRRYFSAHVQRPVLRGPPGATPPSANALGEGGCGAGLVSEMVGRAGPGKSEADRVWCGWGGDDRRGRTDEDGVGSGGNERSCNGRQRGAARQARLPRATSARG
jgi:hypothetical protein